MNTSERASLETLKETKSSGKAEVNRDACRSLCTIEAQIQIQIEPMFGSSLFSGSGTPSLMLVFSD